MYYDAIYNKKLDAFENNSMSKFLNDSAKFFYANLMNGDVISPSKLKEVWDRKCRKYPDYITPQKCLDGLNLLMKLYNWAKKVELIILGMSTPYRLLFKDDKIIVGYSGEIEVVAMQKKGKPEILITDFSSRVPDLNLLDTKLKYTLDSFGYLETAKEKVGVHIHHVNTDKDFFTFRNANDLQRCNTTIKNVAYCINQNLFYPRENFYCTGCGIKHFCKGWH